MNTQVTGQLRDRGIWIRAPAYIIPIAPPLIITADQLDHLATSIDEAITEVEKELGVG